jgi:hypothetical protein
MEKLLVIFFIIFATQNCKSQDYKVKLKELNFKSIFGEDEKDSKNIYCLLGTGFFRTPRSENAEQLIQDWIERNNDAKVILVSTIVKNNGNVNYCWLVDKNGETINEYLVQNGCFPGGTMMRPNTYKEMSKKEKKMFTNEKPNIIVIIDKNSYDEFIIKIKLAETFARENKLGIWKEK